MKTENIYLIAHKVRGEAQLDIAEKQHTGFVTCTGGFHCEPYWAVPIDSVIRTDRDVPDMPDDTPDCFSCNDKAGSLDIDILGILKIKAMVPEGFKRRI
jgi:hypothetical protein